MPVGRSARAMNSIPIRPILEFDLKIRLPSRGDAQKRKTISTCRS
jgi:hypothetical protein